MDNDKKRPVIKIELNDSDKAQEKLALWLLIFLWIAVMVAWFTLPSTIPVHFNIKNEPDKWDDKAYIFMMPFIASLLYALLSFVNKYPQNFNYIKPVTEDNAERLYTQGTRVLRLVKLMIISGFIVDTANDVIVARNPPFHDTTLSMIFQWMPVVLIAGALVKKLFIDRKSMI
jgi:uncharacterized membrane protein